MKPQEIMYNWCDFLIKIIKNYKTKISYSSLIMDNMIRRVRCESNSPVFNPIPAGVLKNQDMLGGSIWPPPSKSHVLCPNMTNNTSLESFCALLLESAKKICKFAKIEFFITNSSYLVTMFAKKNLSKKWKIIHFWKALDHVISNMQKMQK